MDRIYFAHSKLDYYTKREKEALSLIKKKYAGASIICPNCDIGECSRGMHAYLSIVSWASIVIVLEHNKTIGRGVEEEVNRALNLNISCYVIRNGTFLLILGTQILDGDSWKTGYAKLII